MSLHAGKNWREKAHNRPTKETTCHHDANFLKRTQTTTTVRSTMVSAVAMAAARRREQEAVERQEAALGICLQQPQNPPGNIIAGNIIAGAVDTAIDDQALDPPTLFSPLPTSTSTMTTNSPTSTKSPPNHVQPSQRPHLRPRRGNPLHPCHPLRHRLLHLLQNHDVPNGHQRHLRGGWIASHGIIPKAVVSDIRNVCGDVVWVGYALDCVVVQDSFSGLWFWR